MAVFRGFCRVIKTALFALVVCFTTINAFAKVSYHVKFENFNGDEEFTGLFYSVDNCVDYLGTRLPTSGAFSNDMSDKFVDVPSKTGYTFAGYYDEYSGGNMVIDANGKTNAYLHTFLQNVYKKQVIDCSDLSAGHTKIYARWIPNTYTVNFNANGGTIPYGGTTSVIATYDAVVPEINVDKLPVRAGYVFSGYSDETTGGVFYYNFPPMYRSNWNKTNDTVLYAQWKNAVNLYSNCPGGSNTLVATIGVKQNEYMPEYDSTGNSLSKPKCPGYRFLGYWDATSGGTQYYDNTLITDDGDSGGFRKKWDKTGGGNLYAHWETMPDGFHVEIEDTDSFGFYINAAGSYRVYWGDGEYTDVINTRPLTTQNLTKHDYDYDDNYTVTITRLSNEYAGYNSDTQIPAIGFSYDPGYIIGISGSLGSVFPTLSSTSVSGAITQPSFYGTFEDCEYITELPEDLFSGISGTPVPHMFDSTFEDCDSLTSVPGQLFPSFTANSISNADYMFYETFYDCGNLRYIDSDLFAGVSGAPAPHMFDSTFEETRLALVPSGLFSNINGPVQESLFDQTFASTSIETVPADLFAGISGFPAPQAFYETFYGSHVTFFTYSDNRPRISFIPPDFFGSIDVSNYHTDLTSTVTYNNHTYQDTSSWVAYDIFGSTNVLEECPSGYEEYYTGFEDEYSPKVSCIPVNAYTITYNLYGGTNNASNPESYTATSSTITFADPTKTGYTFGGWYTDSTFETPITQIPTGSTGNKTLYAKWVMNLAYIYNDDNNTVNNSMCTYNNNFTVPGIDNEEEVKPGYKFMGWIYRKQ